MDLARYLIDRKLRAQRVLSHLRPHLSGRVLDFGAGDCHLISLIDGQKGLEGYGIDVKDYRQAKSFTRFQWYDGREIPFPDGFFDTAVSVYVIHHIKDQVHVLNEIARVLKPGGSLVLIEDSFHGAIGETIARLYDVLTNVVSFQVPVELNFHSPSEWRKIINGQSPLEVRDMTPLRLGPICKVLPRSLYFKLLIVARKRGADSADQHSRGGS